tara:strand:- start:911 stop:1603 length:693 start_codon:yes stop_codon:yes gene_type:complete
MLNDFTMEGSSMFPNIVTFNANEGFWAIRKDGEVNKIQMPKQVAMDLEVFTKGWNLIISKKAPQSHMAKYDKPFPDKPAENFKKTFCIRMYAKDIGLCEFGSNSAMVGQAIQKFFNGYLESRPDAVKIPVVAIKDNIQVSEWFIPNFEIVKYIDRPEGLTEINVTETSNLAMDDKPNENQFDDSINVSPHMDDRLGKGDKRKKAIPYTKAEEDAEMAKLDAALGTDDDEF